MINLISISSSISQQKPINRSIIKYLLKHIDTIVRAGPNWQESDAAFGAGGFKILL